jgi:hypothetical protein
VAISLLGLPSPFPSSCLCPFDALCVISHWARMTTATTSFVWNWITYRDELRSSLISHILPEVYAVILAYNNLRLFLSLGNHTASLEALPSARATNTIKLRNNCSPFLSPTRNSYKLNAQIAVAARSKARTVFARSNTEIVGAKPTGGMISMYVLCVFILCLPRVEAGKNTSTVIHWVVRGDRRGNQ